MDSINDLPTKSPARRVKASSIAAPSVLKLCCYSLAVFGTVFIQVAEMVKHENFKTCSQSGFCRRNRALADDATAAGTAWVSPYEVDPASFSMNKGQLKATIWKTVDGQEGKVELPLLFSFYEQGFARLQIDEAKRQKGEIELRNGSKVRKERYNEAEKWALMRDLKLNSMAKYETLSDAGVTRIFYGATNPYEAIVRHKPFEVRFLREGEVHMVLNERNLLNVEHWRPKPEPKEGDEDNGEWDETFGGATDSKPRGAYPGKFSRGSN